MWRRCRRTGPRCSSPWARSWSAGAAPRRCTRSARVDDHAYVVDDAGDRDAHLRPDVFERAGASRCATACPGLKRLLCVRPDRCERRPHRAWPRRSSRSRSSRPPVDADDLVGPRLHRRHHRQAEGRDGHLPERRHHDPDQDGRVGVARRGCASWSARRSATPARRFFMPTLLRGRLDRRARRPSSPARCSRRSRSTSITATMLVPTMIYVLLDHPHSPTSTCRACETVFYGASADVADPAARRRSSGSGPIFFQFYGQAESPHDHHRAAQGRARRRATWPASRRCGRPVPWVHVALLDDDGNEVAQGEPGEICVRGPLVMKGYWKKPEETAEALHRRLAAHRRRRPRRRSTASSRSSTARRT